MNLKQEACRGCIIIFPNIFNLFSCSHLPGDTMKGISMTAAAISLTVKFAHRFIQPAHTATDISLEGENSMAGITITTASHAAAQTVQPSTAGHHNAASLGQANTTGVAVSQVMAERLGSEIHTDDKARSVRVPKRTERNFQSEEESRERREAQEEERSKETGVGQRIRVTA